MRKKGILAVFLCVIMLGSMLFNTLAHAQIELVEENHFELGDDFTEHVTYNVTMNLDDELFIENNELVTQPGIVESGSAVELIINWKVLDEVINESDYFVIQLPTNHFSFNFNVLDAEDAHPNNPNPAIYQDLYYGESVLGFWTVDEENKLVFIASDDFVSLKNRSGGFALFGSVDSLEGGSVTEPIQFGSITVENVTFNDPEDTTPPEIEKDFPAEGYEGNKDDLIKYAIHTNGSTRLEWIGSFGLDMLGDVMTYENHDDVQTHENVVIYDTVQGDQYFQGIFISTNIFRPADEHGNMSVLYGSGDYIAGKVRGEEEYSGPIVGRDQLASESYEEWKKAVEEASVPTMGISLDKQSLIINLGTIGKNGLTYGEDNDEIEQILRAKNRYTEEELMVLMKALGYDGEHTMNNGLGETITIDSYGNGHVIAYSIHMNMDVVPGKTYNNTIVAVGDTERLVDYAEVEVKTASGFVEGVNSGNIRLFKINDENHTLLSDATFELQRQVEGKWECYARETTINGELLFPIEEEGKYRLVEVNAPPGYSSSSLKLYKTNNAIEDMVDLAALGEEIHYIDIDFSSRITSNYVVIATNETIKEVSGYIPGPVTGDISNQTMYVYFLIIAIIGIVLQWKLSK